MRRSTLLLAVFALVAAAPAALAQTDAQVANEVAALAKAEWAASIAQRPVSEALKDVADEYTEFNPNYPIRLDGRPLNSRLYEVFQAGAGRLVAAEMGNPQVQVYGDVAILTYNFLGAVENADGEVEANLAKSTRVYVNRDGGWQLVHAHFSPLGNDD